MEPEAGRRKRVEIEQTNAWMRSNKLDPVLSTKDISLRLKRKFYRMCVQRVMVYGSETWPMRAEELRRLESRENDDKMHVRSNVEGQM